jgi:hypothetical protein
VARGATRHRSCSRHPDNFAEEPDSLASSWKATRWGQFGDPTPGARDSLGAFSRRLHCLDSHFGLALSRRARGLTQCGRQYRRGIKRPSQ